MAFRKSLDANAILVMSFFSVFSLKLLTVCKEVVLELAIELGVFTLKIHIAKKLFSLCLSWHNSRISLKFIKIREIKSAL